MVEDVLAEDAEIMKIAIYASSIRELGEVLIPAWQDKVKTCMAGEEWVDFMDLPDKGNALQVLQKYLGVTKSNNGVWR